MLKTNENYRKKDTKERLQELTQQLQESVRNFMDSQKYKAFLKQMAQFHAYSFNNQLLIALQRPDATLCASYAGWKAQKRQVKKGEKGIQIICPVPYKTHILQDKLDLSTGKPDLFPDGSVKKEKVELIKMTFKIGHTFDISQTEGEPLPEIVHLLDGSLDKDQEAVFQAMLSISPVPVSFEPVPGSANGYYSQNEKRIVVDSSLSGQQKLKTLTHEISHALLHDSTIPGVPKDARTREVQAESIACVICSYYGLDTSNYSFGYIASWSSGKNTKELMQSLEVISQTSNNLIIKTDQILARTDLAVKELAEPVLDTVKRRCL